MTRQQWVPPKDTWDHEHCVGCWAKFMEAGVHETLAAGYTTEDDCWICDECFNDLKDEMGLDGGVAAGVGVSGRY